MFVGSVSDNFDERIEQKIFHAEIVVDNTRVTAEAAKYQPIPIFHDFKDERGQRHDGAMYQRELRPYQVRCKGYRRAGTHPHRCRPGIGTLT